MPSQDAQTAPGTQPAGGDQSAGSGEKREKPGGVKGDIPAQPGSAPSFAPGASSFDAAGEKEQKKALDIVPAVKANIIPIGGAAMIVIFAIAATVILRKKPKALCARCSKPVLKGMVYCDECSEPQKPADDAQKKASTSVIAAPQLKEPPAKAKEGPAPAKKVRPSGRVLAVITVRRGENQGFRFNFFESFSKITIGSSPDCDMTFEEDEEISGQHAVISITDGTGFSVHEMGSTTGLYVNNVRLKSADLKSGDVIRMGKTELTFARL